MADQEDEVVKIEETPTEEVVESEEVQSDDEPVEPAESDELSADEITGAKSLFKLLKNESTRENTLRILAKQAGILQDPPETKQEEVRARKDLKATLQDKLGKDWEFFSEKFGPALDDYIKESIAEVRSEHQTDRQANEARQVRSEIVEVTAKLNSETKGDYAKMEGVMSKLAEQILPGPNTSTEQYMRLLYKAAISDQKVSPKNLAGKIQQNRTDAMSRVQGTHGKGDGIDPNARRTLKEAINIAAQSLAKKGK